jgi:hypothetical protein
MQDGNEGDMAAGNITPATGGGSLIPAAGPGPLRGLTQAPRPPFRSEGRFFTLHTRNPGGHRGRVTHRSPAVGRAPRRWS